MLFKKKGKKKLIIKLYLLNNLIYIRIWMDEYFN